MSIYSSTPKTTTNQSGADNVTLGLSNQINAIEAASSSLALPSTYAIRDAANNTDFDKVNINSIKANTIGSIGTTLDIGLSNVTQIVNLGTGALVNTINIGTGLGQTNINLGHPGDVIAIAGSLVTVNSSVLQVVDPNIVLNKNGLISSGGNAGILIEENGVNTGKIVLDPVSRYYWNLQTPIDFLSGTGRELSLSGQQVKTNAPILDVGCSASAGYVAGIACANTTYKGAQIYSGDAYAELSLLSGTTETGVIRLEPRNANKYSAANTDPEIQLYNKSGTRIAVFGNGITRFTSNDSQFTGSLSSASFISGTSSVGALTAASLTCNSIDLTPSSTAVLGEFWRVRITAQVSISFKKIGDMAFFSIPPIGNAFATTSFDYFEFRLPDPTGLLTDAQRDLIPVIPVAFRPSVASNRVLVPCCVWNHTEPFAIAFVHIISNGKLVIQVPGGSSWTVGKASGFHTTISGSYRIPA